jgi:hypothetical protein
MVNRRLQKTAWPDNSPWSRLAETEFTAVVEACCGLRFIRRRFLVARKETAVFYSVTLEESLHLARSVTQTSGART